MNQTRREFCGWLATLPMLAWAGGGVASAILAGCAHGGEKRAAPNTPLGAMQARGVPHAAQSYDGSTQSHAVGAFVTSVQGSPVSVYSVDGYFPQESVDRYALDPNWREILWQGSSQYVAIRR